MRARPLKPTQISFNDLPLPWVRRGAMHPAESALRHPRITVMQARLDDIRILRTRVWRCVGILSLLCVARLAHAASDCWDTAARQYGIDPTLLRTIAQHESGLNDTALHRNPDGSVDIGIMQINSGWLPTLRHYGIDRASLYLPCTNELVGAWILANGIARYGATWRAIGSYNARSPTKQLAYAEQIYTRYYRIRPGAPTGGRPRTASHATMQLDTRRGSTPYSNERSVRVTTVTMPTP